jgi:hypothetical protein
LYCDLRKLEDSSTFERWLTLSDDDDKWEQYAKDNDFTGKTLAGKIKLKFIDFNSIFLLIRFIININISNKKLP